MLLMQRTEAICLRRRSIADCFKTALCIDWIVELAVCHKSKVRHSVVKRRVVETSNIPNVKGVRHVSLKESQVSLLVQNFK